MQSIEEYVAHGYESSRTDGDARLQQVTRMIARAMYLLCQHDNIRGQQPETPLKSVGYDEETGDLALMFEGHRIEHYSSRTDAMLRLTARNSHDRYCVR